MASATYVSVDCSEKRGTSWKQDVPLAVKWRDGRVVESGLLITGYAGNGIAGSNPAPYTNARQKLHAVTGILLFEEISSNGKPKHYSCNVFPPLSKS